MARVAKQTDEQSVGVEPIQEGHITFFLLGETPLIMHRKSLSLAKELILPAAKKNRAEKESTLKHDMEAEFRDALYLNRDTKEPARLHLPAGMFSKSLANAALDNKGAKKAQLFRLTSVVTPNINCFGIPYMFLRAGVLGGMNKSPDIHGRAILPEWACSVTYSYVRNLITETSIINLLAAAGHMIGIGDWRVEKGGTSGRFKLVSSEDATWQRITKTQGRMAQQKAIANISASGDDDESAELLAWYRKEVVKREKSHLLRAKFAA